MKSYSFYHIIRRNNLMYQMRYLNFMYYNKRY